MQISFFCVVLQCHLWSVWLYHNLFQHFLINGMSFRGRRVIIEQEMSALIFPTTLFENIAHAEKNSARYYHKRAQNFNKIIHHFQILIIFEFSRHIFEKYSNSILKNSSSGSRVFPCGQTDVKKLTVDSRNFSNAPKEDISKKNTSFSLDSLINQCLWLHLWHTYSW
jgi:hypothetical protein